MHHGLNLARANGAAGRAARFHFLSDHLALKRDRALWGRAAVRGSGGDKPGWVVVTRSKRGFVAMPCEQDKPVHE